jgi:hypothetical protein
VPAVNVDHAALAAAAVSNGGDCVAPVAASADVLGIIEALGATGRSPKVFASAFTVGHRDLRRLGAAAENVYVVSSTRLPQATPGASWVEEMVADLDASKQRIALGIDTYQMYAAIHLLAERVIPRMRLPVTAANVAAALPNASPPATPGLPTFGFTAPDAFFALATNPPTQFRVFNGQVTVYRYTKGRYQQLFDGKFVPLAGYALANAKP